MIEAAMKKNRASVLGAQIGERIKQARLEADGMKQRELADLLGVSERSVIAYESGEVIPYRFIRKIEDVTGKSAAWILHGDRAGDGGVPEELQAQLSLILDQIKLLRVELAELRD